MLKKIAIVLLAAITLFCSVPLTSMAETEESVGEIPAEVTEEEYIYYTDLFYGYSYYLANDEYFQTYVNDIETIYSGVQSSYQNSPLVVGTGLEHALDTITSPTEITKLLTDTLGITSFTYNDALDAANDEFVRYILSDSSIYSLDKEFGETASMIKKVKAVVEFFNKLESGDTDDTTEGTTEYYVQEAITDLKNAGYLSFITDSTLTTLWNKINASVTLNECFDATLKEIEIARAIVTALVMEDSRLEIVNQILSTQSSDTILKQGMTRLKSNLEGNFVTYFVKNYLEDKLINKVHKTVDGLVLDMIGGKELKLLTKVVKEVLYKTVDVPDFGNVLKWQVLICYSNDLADAITSIANSYSTTNKTSDDIIKYENMFVAYDAINKAAMKIATDIEGLVDPFGKAYSVFHEAVNNGIETVTLTTSGIDIELASNLSDEEVYEILTAATIISSTGASVAIGKTVKVSNGISSVEVPIKTNVFTSIMQGGLSENWENINQFNTQYGSDSVFGKHIENVIETILATPAEERQFLSRDVYSTWTYYLSDMTILRQASDEVESGCIYGVNGYVLGNVEVTGPGYSRLFYLIVGIAGNLRLNANRYNGASVTVPKGANICIDGNVRLDSDYNIATSHLTNYGELTITGSLTSQREGIQDTVYNSGILKVKGDVVLDSISSGYLEVGGNLALGIVHSSNIKQIVFNGVETQTIKNLTVKESIDVYNPNGIEYLSDLILHGKYTLHGCPLYYGNYDTLLYDGGSFGDDSDYGRIKITTSVNLTSNVKGNIKLETGYYNTARMIVPQDAKVCIDGEVYTSSWKSVYITNEGHLTITGSLAVGGRVTNNGTLKVKGNFVADYTTSQYLEVGGDLTLQEVTTGYFENLIFNGVEEQNINGTVYNSMKICTLILDNTSEEGVIFNKPISASILFNHKGNNFTLYNNGTDSTFVDYDGDGMKDNVDPEPTVGNPCTVSVKSADEAQGSVSDTTIETVGGTEITVSATPTYKYEFAKWTNASGQTVSTEQDYTFVVTADTTLIANFVKRSRNISVSCEGGTITAPQKATIESEVEVTVTENEGYVYVAGSLKQNDTEILDNKFIMPDEDVVVEAEFARNEYYFALKEKLAEASAYTYEDYSASSFAVLQETIAQAEEDLVNAVSQEVAEEHMAALDEAIGNLEMRYITSLELVSMSEIYLGLEYLQEVIEIEAIYDNGVTLPVYDYTVDGYQKELPGKQDITLEYEGHTLDISIEVVYRKLEDCSLSGISSQVYQGNGETCEVPVIITYDRNGETLQLDEDYTLSYADNDKTGTATVTITGVGYYEGNVVETFEIYCEHNYEEQEYEAPTCAEDGYGIDVCSICDDVVYTTYETLGHSYVENGYFVEYPVTEGDAVFEYRCTECNSSVSFESLDSMLGESSVFVSAETMADLGMMTSEGGFATEISMYNTGYEAGVFIGLYNSSASNPWSDGYLLRIIPHTDHEIALVIYSASDGCVLAENVLSDIWIEDFSVCAWIENGSIYVVVDGSYVYSAELDESVVMGDYCSVYGATDACAEIRTVEKLPYLRFSGASLTLQNNLAIKYRVKKSVIDGFYENPYAVFEMAGKQTKVTSYTEDGDYYLFEFKNIAPNQMNDTIYATLYGEFNGTEYASATVEYGVATYCYNMLPKLTSDSYAKLRTLLVDLLNYGAEAQIYTDYNTDNLVNAALTEEQAAWGTQGEPELETVLNTKYATVDSPSVTWKNAILNLKDSITIQVMLATEDTIDLKVKFTDKDGKVLATVSESQFVETDGGYYVNFKGLHAGQMSEEIYITAYRDDVAVSNTVQYSIESYAYSKQDSDYLNLGDLVKAMMKYGNAAYAYSN